ncbi:Protein tipD [Diplonema papillatum]|nr:Protein tipD [Diplonema papillatum]
MEAVSASEEKWLANLSHAIRRRNVLFVLPYEGIMTALAGMQATFPIAGNTKSQQAQKGRKTPICTPVRDRRKHKKVIQPREAGSGGGRGRGKLQARQMEAVSASEEKWLANLSHAIWRRNALFVLPYEGIMTALAGMQATCASQRKEIDTLRNQRGELSRKLQSGAHTSASNSKYVTDLESKARDLEAQQRKWVGDARVIIDAQKEKKTLQDQVKAMLDEMQGLRADNTRLADIEKQHSALLEEAAAMRADLTQLRLDYDKNLADKKTMADENIHLMESALVSKKVQADRMNEILDLEKCVKDLREKLKSVNTGQDMASNDSFVDNPAAASSYASNQQEQTRAFSQPPAKLARKLEHCHQRDVSSIRFSSSGAVFATGSSDKVVRLWDTKTLSEKAQLRSAVSSIIRVDFSPTDDVIVAATSDGSAVVWSTQTHRHLFSLCGHNSKITGLAFDDDRTLLTCSNDRTIRRWDLHRSGACTKTTMCWSTCTDLASGGCSLICSAHYDGGLRFWDTRTVTSVEELKGAHPQAVASVTFSSCGNKVLSVSKDGVAKYWDIRNYSALFKLDFKDFETMHSLHKATLSPDDNFLAVGLSAYDAPNAIQIYDTRARPKLRSTLKGGHSSQISQVAWSGEGNLLVSADLDGSVCAWTS